MLNRRLSARNHPCLNLNTVQDGSFIKIIDGVYIGTSVAAEDITCLRSHGITHIINLGSSDKVYEDQFKILRICIDDNNESDILTILPLTNLFISCAQRVGNVYIHCREGRSRSPAVIIAYLIKEKQWSYEKAFTFVKEKRSIIDLKLSFQEQLRCYAMSRGNLFEAEDLYRKQHFSSTINHLDHGTSSCDHISTISIPQFSFRFNLEKGHDIALLQPLVQPLFCKQCNTLLTTRNRVFTQQWEHSHDVDDFSGLTEILFSFDPTASFSPPDPSSPDAVDSFVAFVCSLGPQTHYGEEQLRRLREGVKRFATCCEEWCDCAFAASELKCDCCGWMRQQVWSKQTSLTCPNAGCGCVVGKVCLSSEEPADVKIVMYRDCIQCMCLLKTFQLFFSFIFPAFSSLPPQ